MEEIELIKFIGGRFLEDAGGNMIDDKDEIDDPNSSTIIKQSLRLYGSIFLFGFVLYCCLRKKYPRIYAVRQWAINCKHPIANEQFGYLSWTWKVFAYEPEVFREAVGLDAICFIRLLNMGFRLAAVGCFNSIWLFAVYGTAENNHPDAPENDVIGDVAINSLQPGSMRFLAPVLAAYLFFGYTFYTILKEFKWFIAERHIWLRKFTQRNYTVFVRGIPKELRSDKLLLEHFQALYRKERVLEAHVVLHISDLESQVAKRKACVANLEHALAELAINGKRPKHTLIKKAINTFTVGADFSRHGQHGKFEVDSIDYYTEELNELNRVVNDKINEIEKKQRPKLNKSDGERGRIMSNVSSLGLQSFFVGESQRLLMAASKTGEDDVVENMGKILESPDEHLKISNASPKSSKNIFMKRAKGIVTGAASTAKGAGSTLIKKTVKNTKKRAGQAKKTVVAAKSAASTILVTEEDGRKDDAGFVTFSSLVAMQAALQMSQHCEPFVFETEHAPDDPTNIFWKNVGKDKEVRQTGFVISTAITVALCLFWTFIVTAITNLTKAEYLSTQYPDLEETLEENPWIGTLLTLISPLLLLIFNSGLLPVILKIISRLEFPASDASLEASAFWKMAIFTIIQTFFVAMISGSIIQQIAEILDNPQQFVKFLAEALPQQSSFFTQLLIVSTCLGTLVELFRVVPLSQGLARAFLGKRLTEKERNKVLGPLKPLSYVDKFYFSRVQARFILYFMVLFVYSTISPLINWFCLFFFLLLRSVYRHQFVFNFPNKPDTGGEMWIYFMHVLLACIIISQLTLMGFLTLKEFAISIPLMVPLLVITCIFIMYLRQRHFTIGTYLAARACLSQDLANEGEGVDYNIFKNQYKNPALMERIAEPDWDSGKNEKRKAANSTHGTGVEQIPDHEDLASTQTKARDVEDVRPVKEDDEEKEEEGSLADANEAISNDLERNVKDFGVSEKAAEKSEGLFGWFST